MKKKIIVGVVLAAVIAVGAFVGLKLHKEANVKKPERTETAQDIITKSEVENADGSAESANVELTDEERNSYVKLYEKYGTELDKSVTVSDEEVTDYMKKNEIQYPAGKVIGTRDGKDTEYYADDIDGLEVGKDSDFGVIKSITDLTDEDKREVVKSIIHSNKVTNILVKHIKEAK